MNINQIRLSQIEDRLSDDNELKEVEFYCDKCDEYITSYVEVPQLLENIKWLINEVKFLHTQVPWNKINE